MRLYLVQIVLLLLVTSCQGPNSKQDVPDRTAIHKVVVKEAINTNSYTYLRVKEGRKEIWLAVPRMEAEIGATYYYSNAMEMKDFPSKELDRVFKSVFFLEKVSTSPENNSIQMGNMGMGNNTTPVKPKIVQEEVTIKGIEGAITIAELFASKEKYEGKTVTIKGQITKYNEGIMNKNWLHLQDGTDQEGNFDLTVTSLQEFQVGNIVVLEGKISLNKDFGYGYSYAVLMEDAIVKE